MAIYDSSDVLCFDLYLINIFAQSTKAERYKSRYVQADTLFVCLFLYDCVVCLLLYEDISILGTRYFVFLNSTLGAW